MFSLPVRGPGRSCAVCCIALLFVLSAWGMSAHADLKDEPLRLTLKPPSSVVKVYQHAFFARSGRPAYRVYSLADLPARISRTGKLLQVAGSARLAAPGELIPSVSSENCGHDSAPEATSVRPGRHGGRPGPALESEHQPVPERTYHLTDLRRLAHVEAFVRRPDGSVIKPELHLGVNPGLSFPTPMGDGPAHGANSVYVVEQGVKDNVFVVRTAKWITLHHSCGWGHNGKFDKTKTNPQALDTIPFEIVINKLWDPNFHACVTSGDQLVVTVLSYGKPVSGAHVTLSTEKGWSKQMVTNENGRAALQLIRDYYPSSWPDFHRTFRGRFLVTAGYDVDRRGSFRDKPYERVSYITTLPWKYSPSSQDYSSYTYGLLIGALTLTVSGVGVYAYRERRKKPYRGISFDE